MADDETQPKLKRLAELKAMLPSEREQALGEGLRNFVAFGQAGTSWINAAYRKLAPLAAAQQRVARSKAVVHQIRNEIDVIERELGAQSAPGEPDPARDPGRPTRRREIIERYVPQLVRGRIAPDFGAGRIAGTLQRQAKQTGQPTKGLGEDAVNEALSAADISTVPERKVLLATYKDRPDEAVAVCLAKLAAAAADRREKKKRAPSC